MNYINTIPAETLFYVLGSLTGVITLFFIYLKLRNLYTISNHLISTFALATAGFFIYNYFVLQDSGSNFLSLPVIHDFMRIVTP
ncbi:hypothetical protein [Bacillus toyonensis]|uniref:hypothetical protein n=1 Tax=Bacillus toyonensis TaxID=155322 RepID=UPI00211D977C|nr:hypothetical protein [Bacillus toyonensis]